MVETAAPTDALRVLSLNCWGLKWVSKVRAQRIQGIARILADRGNNYDIVALQEIWVEDDFKLIEDALLRHLPYNKMYYSGILSGPGLAVFSRWPIESASVFPYTLNGRPSAFFRGDWYVGKSVASAVIAHPSQKIEVLSSHMHAPYGPGDAAYTCHRTAQAWDLARHARRSVACGYLTIVVGDLNSIPGSATYSLLELIGGLSDSWAAKYGHFDGDIESLSLEEQVKTAGITCDSLLNTWRKDRAPHEAKRLDYIFFDPTRATVADCRVSFIEELPGVGSCSDHFAIEADLVLGTNPIAAKGVGVDKAASTQSCARLYEEILDLIDEYWPTSRWQKRIRLQHFWLSIVVLVGLMVGVFWGAAHNRAYVGFIFIVVATVVSVTGVIDGLIGFLFGRHEERALREFESEIRMALKLLKDNDGLTPV